MTHLTIDQLAREYVTVERHERFALVVVSFLGQERVFADADTTGTDADFLDRLIDRCHKEVSPWRRLRNLLGPAEMETWMMSERGRR